MNTIFFVYAVNTETGKNLGYIYDEVGVGVKLGSHETAENNEYYWKRWRGANEDAAYWTKRFNGKVTFKVERKEID